MAILRIFGLIYSISFFIGHSCFAKGAATDTLIRKVDQEILKLMHEGDIPGLSLVVIQGNTQIIKSYGYADISRGKPVTPATLFEIGSCSKSFTALAIARLAQEHKVKLDDDVSDYIPWFRVTYKNKPAKVTIRQLLHHTGGIPWNTISKIPQSGDQDALERTVRQLTGQELRHLPGELYEYATINYDVLGLIIQVVTRQSFEAYVQGYIINPLGLYNTTVGRPRDSTLLATGYKISFFTPRAYKAPVFRGNNPAGYFVTDAKDIAGWLQFQMGLVDSEMGPLAKLTHQRDETVPLHHMNSYAMGWEVSLNGSGEIHHGGLNPNYSSYLIFRPKDKLGVAVLTNSNSSFTPVIAARTMKLLAGEKMEKEFSTGDQIDKAFSIICLLLAVYTLAVLAFLVSVAVDIFTERRGYEAFSFGKAWTFLQSFIIVFPFLFGLYLLPKAMFGFDWQAIQVWAPTSLPVATGLMLVSTGISYLVRLVELCYPEKNKFRKIFPQLLLLSVLSGLANMALIMLVSSSLNSEVELKYQLFYFLLTLSVYLLGRKYVQVNLILFSRELTFEIRTKLINKILSTTYEKFEKIDRGRVYTAVNDDVDTLGQSSNMVVMLITNFITAAGAFLYLSIIAFWASVLTVLLILVLVTLYFFVIRQTNRYYQEARDTRNVFMRLVNGMIDGFKEISLKKDTKLDYQKDVVEVANEYKMKMSTAGIQFVNASLVGEMVLIMLLGAVAYAFPEFFPEIQSQTLMSFIIVLLYLIGPINTILGSVPAVTSLRVAWNRIQQFLKEIPANILLTKTSSVAVAPSLDSIRVEGVCFTYKKQDDQEVFVVGPIDLEVKRGEVLFVVGGNGSGKTTLAKLLTGLYEPDKGKFRVNGEVIESGQLGSYFSAIFSPICLFEKLYGTNVTDRSEEVGKYLKLLNLENIVELIGNKYSTINLSAGQRKRLALLQCFLENSPIYLFDEWAADQDPEYRRFFYRTLLPQMRERGKIVIAITHDDHYFDVADKILKMNQGKVEIYSNKHRLNPISQA